MYKQQKQVYLYSTMHKLKYPLSGFIAAGLHKTQYLPHVLTCRYGTYLQRDYNIYLIPLYAVDKNHMHKEGVVYVLCEAYNARGSFNTLYSYTICVQPQGRLMSGVTAEGSYAMQTIEDR